MDYPIDPSARPARQCNASQRTGSACGWLSSWSEQRRQAVWAWASLLVLVICWDAASRLDQHLSLPSTNASPSSTGATVRTR